MSFHFCFWVSCAFKYSSVLSIYRETSAEIPSWDIMNTPISKQNIKNTNSLSLSRCLSLSLGIGAEVSQGEYNISSEESGKGLFTVTSFHSVTAAKSSRVVCLASVSALTTPLNSSVRLIVGERTQPVH